MSDIRFNQWLHNSGTGGVSQVDGGHVGIGTTNPEIAVHSGNNKILNVGIVTASTYYGDGSNLTGITDNVVNINNNADNRIITGSGTANTLEGEANLRFDGSLLTVSGKIACDLNSDIDMSGGADGQLQIGGNGYTSAIALNDEAMQIYHNSSSRGIIFGINETEKLRIESNGRIAVGGFSGADSDLHIKTAASPTVRLQDTTNDCILLSYAQDSNAHVGTYSSHDLIFDTNSTEKLRILSNGAITCGHGANFNLHGSSTTGICLNGNGNSGQIIANADGNRALIIGRQSSFGQVIEFFQGSGGSNTNMAGISIPAADTLGLETNGTENFRVTSQGRVRIKCQDMDNDPWTTNRGVMIGDSSTGSTFSNGSSTSTANNIIFANGNGLVGKISTNGSTTTYHTSSDYRLKENAVPISDGIARLKTLKPYKFNFKADPSTTLDGFFAHEVSSAVPEAVDGEKDELYTEDYLGYKVGDQKLQTLDSSKLIPLLTAALKEAIAKIETLEAEVAALKGS